MPGDPLNDVVVIGGCESYREPDLTSALVSILEPLGGMAAFVKAGETILIKPNFVFGRNADKAVTTHPLLIVSLVSLVLAEGAKVVIGDSPALESTERVARACGLSGLIKGLDCSLVSFGPDKCEIEAPPGAVFRRFEVARVLKDVDGVINLAKLKTHGQMTLTAGVKNIFGCVVGLEKAHWHMKAGNGHNSFAGMLLDLYDAVKPRLTIIDAITAMEGNGPLSGTPRHLGFLGASLSARALDCVVARMTGFAVEEVPTLLEAGMTTRDLNVEYLDSAPTGVVRLERAAGVSLQWLPFPSLRALARRIASERPVFDEKACTSCNVCVQVCPARALKISTRQKCPVVDLTACIRCFCCQEMCPNGAVRIREGWLLRCCSFVSKCLGNG